MTIKDKNTEPYYIIVGKDSYDLYKCTGKIKYSKLLEKDMPVDVSYGYFATFGGAIKALIKRKMFDKADRSVVVSLSEYLKTYKEYSDKFAELLNKFS